MINQNTTVLIATFSPWKNGKRLPINGNVEPMIDFFTTRVKKTVLIDQVYPGSDFVMPPVEYYEKKKQTIKKLSWWVYCLYPFLKLTNTGATHISFKLRDFLSVLDVGMQTNKPYDYFIGLEAINALAGVLLKKLGKVKKVIYYVSDYSPMRYKQKWFNALYLWLDRQAAMHADVIWDVSSAMQPARIKAGLVPEKSAPVLQVPNALYPKQISQAKESEIIPYSLVFMGTLGKENGPDLAIESLALVVKKFPKTVLHIVGGGEGNEDRLERLVKKLHLQKSVVFHGFIGEREIVSATIRKFSIALAPYVFILGSARLYGDATKIRAYLAAGLPTITTQVPPLGREAEKKGAVVVVGDNKQEIAEAINEIFLNKTLYKMLRTKAFAFAKNNTWEKEFTLAFKKMERFTR
ncbi:MAG TPA: glycosyltransferase [Patescibacteria group bacterium]|nr:glycosyltransferase [Patescibacteria group bacterium]